MNTIVKRHRCRSLPWSGCIDLSNERVKSEYYAARIRILLFPSIAIDPTSCSLVEWEYVSNATNAQGAAENLHLKALRRYLLTTE